MITVGIREVIFMQVVDYLSSSQRLIGDRYRVGIINICSNLLYSGDRGC